VGKDKFRLYGSLDAEAIRKFRLELWSLLGYNIYSEVREVPLN
jgi:hypothetical protein